MTSSLRPTSTDADILLTPRRAPACTLDGMMDPRLFLATAGALCTQERRQAKTLSGERSSTSCGLRPQTSSTSRDPADFAHHRRRHPLSFTPPHAPKCSCMRLSTARLHFPCLPCARLRFPGSRCVHLLCYCTCLYCSNIVCFSLVLLYLLVLSCTCMPMLISDIPSSIHWEYSLYTSVGSFMGSRSRIRLRLRPLVWMVWLPG